MISPAISIVTLGVSDLRRSTTFYEALGFRRSSASQDAVSFFQLGNIVLAVFGDDALAEDSGLALHAVPAGSSRGMTLAQNYPSEAAVDDACRAAEAAGAQVVVRPAKTFWGGYHAVFTDPDGHAFELAHNPFFDLRDDGTVALP